LPSIGASGGIITIWKSAQFTGSLAFSNNYVISVDLHSNHDQADWILTIVYGPCTPEGKLDFIDWIENIQMADGVDWLVVGDFNLIRDPYNRNKPSVEVNIMLLFNEAISAQGWIELPLDGRKFTWSNKQAFPLLERLEYFLAQAPGPLIIQIFLSVP
jgi:hypothetical protein